MGLYFLVSSINNVTMSCIINIYKGGLVLPMNSKRKIKMVTKQNLRLQGGNNEQ